MEFEHSLVKSIKQGVAMAWDPRLKETRRMLVFFVLSLFAFSVFEPHLPSASAATLWSDGMCSVSFLGFCERVFHTVDNL